MSTTGLQQLYTESFSTNLRLRLQQTGSRLRGKVMEGFHVGKQASPVDYQAAVSSSDVSGRFEMIDGVDQDFLRRWVMPRSKDLPQWFDNFDKLKTLQDPQSNAVRNAANAFGRDWDDEIINKAFATASISNVDGTTLTTESFDTTNFGISEKFGDGSTAVGFTVDKMIEANRIFRHYHVDLEDQENEERTWIMGSKQESDAFKLTEVVSTEFNDRPVLVDGRLIRFLGWNMIVSERLLYGTGLGSSSNCRQNIGFVKSGMYLGIWQDMTHDISQLKNRRGLPWQVYSMHTFGATRLEPGRVLRIDCANDSTGADITA